MSQIAKFREKYYYAPQDTDLEDSIFWRKSKLMTSAGAERDTITWFIIVAGNVATDNESDKNEISFGFTFFW